ncbi:glycosyltransferase [Allokutzneria sp. A3M-2-11 16]|uniref:glycosyltransferase family 2 protein n=1 Tax=Allokutzneria sp. A3M-2-11 16 TaxID=2962043 RepID=UPI0020B87F21|nr:glycosyltransferase family 2 protein [Allokutzneria sp. A3M-2-11 16]MCP3800509.1 glycosyltransferase [Allokutzneria sp. A3M-2-11 16]
MSTGFSGTPLLRTAPVLAVLVCHDADPWLDEALAALRELTLRPRHILAVDTGSVDGTAETLRAACTGVDKTLDGVLTLPRETGFSSATAAAVTAALQRWGDPGQWIWLLHDDCAPEPDCLAALLTVAEVSPSAAVLGPLCLEWTDPRLVVEAGVSTDSSGHRQTGIGPGELDWGRYGEPGAVGVWIEQNTEALAVSSAGALVRREVWQKLHGFDEALPLFGDDIDFGWRANIAGYVVIVVPAARIRHATAAAKGNRSLDALDRNSGLSRTFLALRARREHGLRTVLVNCSLLSFVLGLPRLAILGLLRGIGFALLRRFSAARAELSATARLLSGRAGLLAARRDRRLYRDPDARDVRGLFTSRLTRLRNAARGGLTGFLRSRLRADAALGRLPARADRLPTWTPSAQVGPPALPAGALGRRNRPARLAAGLRRPARAVVVEVPEPAAFRPSPRPRAADPRPAPELVVVEVDRARVLRELLLSPAVLLVAVMVLLALVIHAARLGGVLSGGELLPIGDLAQTWSEYLASWHGVGGGTTAPATPALAVLGSLGALLGGPPVAVAVLLLADLPLSGLTGYLATRRLPVARWVRAVAAAGYALLPAATAATAQGRLEVVVVHVFLPLVLAGVAAAVGPATGSWLSVASGTALGLAVIGAFSPLTHLLVLVVAVIAFVLVGRSVTPLVAIVLLPLGLLLPWPAVIVQHPEVLLPGGPAASAFSLAALNPGGPGGTPWVGFAVLAAVVLALVACPRREVLPGVGLVVLGAAVVAVLPGWAGAPLLLVGCGMLWIVLAAVAYVDRPRPLAFAAPVVLLWLAVGALVVGREGPLRVGEEAQLGKNQAAELASTSSWQLIVGERPWLVRGRSPRFGDSALQLRTDRAPVLAADFTSYDQPAVRTAVSRAAAAGVRFVVLPDSATADRVKVFAPDLVATVPARSDGRPVLRLLRVQPPAVLLPTDVGVIARSTTPPPEELAGVAPVPGGPPAVAVRVSRGAEARLLVLAATDEPGWRASVDGEPANLTRAWGGQVALTLPGREVEVRVEVATGSRDVLLLVQAFAALFALLTAIPTPTRFRAE